MSDLETLKAFFTKAISESEERTKATITSSIGELNKRINIFQVDVDKRFTTLQNSVDYIDKSVGFLVENTIRPRV